MKLLYLNLQLSVWFSNDTSILWELVVGTQAKIPTLDFLQDQIYKYINIMQTIILTW